MTACKGTTKDKVANLLAAVVENPSSVNTLIVRSTFSETSRNQVIEWLQAFESVGLTRIDRSGREGIWHWTGRPLAKDTTASQASDYARGIQDAAELLLRTAGDYDQMTDNTETQLRKSNELGRNALAQKAKEYAACAALLKGQAQHVKDLLR